MDISACFGFYGILTNPIRGYEYVAKLLVDYEVRFIQLRMKKETLKEKYREAERIRKITDGTQSQFIINDDPRMAAEICADGVHLGQDDTTLEEAVKMLPPSALIGLSTHNPSQTEEACKKKPSYIGIGPVYATPTKVIPDPVLGLSGMVEMLAKATVPAVAIGGIDQTNLAEVLKSGARNFCSVRPVNSSDSPEKALKELLKIYRDFQGI